LQGRNAVNPADDQTALRTGAFSGKLQTFPVRKRDKAKTNYRSLGRSHYPALSTITKETRHADPRHRLG
jgi:hypothetical protein